MSVYRNISTNFWTDSKIDDCFTPEDKYFYLYLLTNPHTNITGCYEIGDKQFERELGYNSDTIQRLIARMQDQHKVLRYSRETKEVLLLNWGKYNWGKSPKVKTAVERVAAHIKNQTFRDFVLDAINDRVAVISNQETVNNKSVDSKQYTVSSTQKTDTVVPVEYGYSIDTVSCGADERALTDYQSVVDDYLSTCSRLPAVKSLSEARKKTIKARLNTYTAEQLHEAFKRANESDFLCGKNDRDWVATFDWILKDANLAKILDGNYENRSGRGGNIPDYSSPASLKMSL